MQETIRKLGVIGDVHAECSRLEAAINELTRQQVDCIVCTGDIVDGEGCPDKSIELLQQASVHTVRGNHDRWILEHKARHIEEAHQLTDLSPASITYLENLPTQVTLDTIHGKLLLCHGVADDDLRKVWPGTTRMPVERSRELDRILESGLYRYMINGHMHFRTVIHFEQMTLINAGTLKGPHWPGFSIIDFEQAQVGAFEFDEDQASFSRSHALTPDNHTVWSDTQSFTGSWEPVRLF